MKSSIRKIWSIFILALALLALVGCGDNQAKVLANKLYIVNHDEITGSFALPKYVEGNKNAPVTWESSHPNIVSIGEYPEWEHPAEDDTMQPSPDLYYKATVVLPTEETKVTLKATVTYENKKATRDLSITVVADTYAAKTIKEAKATSLGTKVKVEGTVVFVSDNGYALKDDTGHLYVYISGHGRRIGDKVVVRGETDKYNNMPQLKNSTVEKTGEEENFDPYADLEEITLAELMAHPVDDADFYTTMYKIKGKIYSTDDRYNPFHIADPLDRQTFVGISNYSSSASLEDIEDYEEKYVEMVILIYSSYQGAYSVCYIEETAEETEIQYTEKQKADITLNKMVDLVKDEILTWDITLPTTDSEFNATVKWESSKPEILTNDGKFTAPAEETTVKLKVTVTVGNTKVDKELELKALKLDVTKANDLIDMTPLKSGDEEPLVFVQGKVLGHQYGGYWVADETGAVLIYTQNRPNIGEIVQVKGYVSTYKPEESFNIQIKQIEYRTLKDADEPTLIAAEEMSIEDIFALGVNSQDKAVEVAKDYYGKLITITGTVRGSGHYWYIDGETDGQFFRLNNLESNKGLVEGENVTITVMVRDLYYIDDTSSYNNFKAGAFGGVFFGEDAIVKNN